MKRATLAALALAALAAPATASAATIDVATTDGFPAIVYKAKPGEVNAVQMVGTAAPFDLRMAFFEYRARLSPGPGCAERFPVICGDVFNSFPVNVSLGDRSDEARVNSFTERVTMDAGSGDDDVLAGGFDATADGGSGDDTIHVAANNGARGNGGSGRDRVSGGLGAVAAILDGGSGGDLLVPDASFFDDAKGGTGDDRLVSLRGSEVRLSGGEGDDLLVALAGGNVLLDGGDDDDFAFTHAGGATVDGGAGNDVIEAQGGPETAGDTVTCGTGWDVAWIDEADTVAADCEVTRRSAAPAFRKVATAEADAQALLAHRPDPSNR